MKVIRDEGESLAISRNLTQVGEIYTNKNDVRDDVYLRMEHGFVELKTAIYFTLQDSGESGWIHEGGAVLHLPPHA